MKAKAIAASTGSLLRKTEAIAASTGSLLRKTEAIDSLYGSPHEFTSLKRFIGREEGPRTRGGGEGDPAREEAFFTPVIIRYIYIIIIHNGKDKTIP